MAKCIKVPAESFREYGGLSRAFFEAREGVTKGREVAAEVLSQG